MTTSYSEKTSVDFWREPWNQQLSDEFDPNWEPLPTANLFHDEIFGGTLW